jgi:succinyl-CoA synthetase beta subunit
MKLLEFEAKSLLAHHNVPVPRSFIAGSKPKFLPAVIKSQVPVGGRGKAGGVVHVKTEAEYKKAVSKIKKLPIKGFLPAKLLAESTIDIRHEYYLSILVNKELAEIELMAHTNGGVEVEENKAADFLRLTLTGKNAEAAGEELADYFDLPDKSFVLQDLVENLYDCFTKNDALLLEINPLILASSGDIVAADCKMELDDAAKFRHKDWNFQAGETNANFVTLDEKGNVATIANGAGLAMATVDAVANAGFNPANFLDVGGGANEASVLAAFQRIMQYPNIKVIVINIFAGITRCDEVAKAIIAAKSQIRHLPPLSIRLAGTNFEQAAELLSAESIPTLATLEDCISNAKEHVK